MTVPKDRKKRKDMARVVEVDGRRFEYTTTHDGYSCDYCDLFDFCDSHPHVAGLCEKLDRKGDKYLVET